MRKSTPDTYRHGMAGRRFLTWSRSRKLLLFASLGLSAGLVGACAASVAVCLSICRGHTGVVIAGGNLIWSSGWPGEFNPSVRCIQRTVWNWEPDRPRFHDFAYRGAAVREVVVPLWLPILGSGLITALLAAVPSRRAARDLCTTCRYCLLGNTSGICPECGTAIPEKQRTLLACLAIDGSSAVASSGPDRALGDGVGHPRKTKENMP